MKVFYDERMVSVVKSMSPSAGKPKLVVEDWQKHFGDKIDIVRVDPVDPLKLSLTHSSTHVRGVLKGTIENGFGNTDRKVAESCLWTVGSFLSAAEYVAKNVGIVCSPTSGFHHAHPNECGGFCTFNGLAVAAHALEDVGKRVGILDLDYHYGDGTAEFIYRRKINVIQVSGEWSRNTSGEKMIQLIPDWIDSMDCDVLFYQAGADMHMNDPIGGIMTTEQLQRRDRTVFQYCKERKIPCAYCLAGGYSSMPLVLEIHRNTMHESIEASE